VDAIEEYFHLTHKAVDAYQRAMLIKSLPLLVVKLLTWTGLDRWIDKGFHKLSSITVLQGLNMLTKNKELQAILGYNWGDYGCEPSRAPFIMQLLVSKVFLNGGYYPRGGPSVIPRKIIQQINDCGGQVLVKAPVKSITVEPRLFSTKKKVTGVEMTDGRVIQADKVVSDAGYENTIGLLPPNSISGIDFSGGDCVDSVKLHSGASAISLFVGLKGHWRSLDLPESQVWIYADHDTSSAVQKLKAMSLEEALEVGPKDMSPIFVGNPCSKDKSWGDEFPNKCVLEIICLGPRWSWFERFRDTYEEGTKSHGPEYESIKRRFAEKMWERVSTNSPSGIVAYITYSAKTN